MVKTQKILSFILLFVSFCSNVATPVSYAAELKLASSTGQSASKSEVLKPVPRPKFLQPDTGSVLGASTSLFEIGTQSQNEVTGTMSSANKRIPIRMQQLEKKVYQITENVTLGVTNPTNEPITTSVVDEKGQPVSIPINETNDGTTTTVQLTASNQIKPGKYTIKVSDDQGTNMTQDFTWGVLALNTDKSMYHPGETGDISIGVLNDKGDMVCDAQVTLSITNQADGIKDMLSTSQASGSAQIAINPQCQVHDFSLQPDYEAQYTFSRTGTYELQLTAKTPNGTHTINDSLQVKNDIPFDVQRVSATRIYPPNTYPMTMNITANRDFSGTVTETVPEDFVITPATTSATTVTSYNNMQTVYLNANDPGAQLQQAIIASSSGGLVLPFKGNYPITQGFGVQLTDPSLEAFYIHYGLAGHDGIDFGLPMNTQLFAVDDGTILWAGPGDYGITIIIQHKWGKSYYGHLATPSVKVGDQVSKGQLIGYSGESGEATGPHLHFGMKPLNPDMKNGYSGKVDPLPYIPYNNQQSESISTLNPTLALAASQKVLSASTSANTDTNASDSATVSPTLPPSETPAISASVTPTSTSIPSPTIIPSPTQQTTIVQTPTPPKNTDFTVLDKQILLSEQIATNAQTQRVKVLTWNVSLKKGESTSIGYDYQAPHISPQFYLMGPLQFYQKGSGKVVFQEQRQWEIASDDVGVEWYQNTSGNKWNGYSWQYRKKLSIDHTKISVAGTNATHVNSSSLTSSTLSSGHVDVTGVNAGAGDLIVVSAEAQTGHTTNGMSVKDLTNNTNFTTITECDLSSSSSRWLQTFYYQTPQALSNATVELTPFAGATNASMSVDVFRGVGTVQGVTATCNQAAAATTATGTSLSAAPYKNSLVLGFGASVDNMSARTATYPWVGGSASSGGANNPSTAIEYILSADGSTAYAGDFTNASSQSWAVVTATFNSASSQPAVDFMDSGGDATNTNSGTNLTTSTGGFYSASSGTVAYDTGTKETGPGSIKFTSGGAGAVATVDATGILANAGRRISAYYNVTNLPTGNLDILLVETSGAAKVFTLQITSGGVLQLTNGGGTQLGSNGATLSTSAWNRIDVSYTITSTTNYSINVYVNGTQSISYSQSSGGTALANGTSDTLFLGWGTASVGNSKVMNIDDVYVDSGTDLTDPGDVHVTNKIPIGDGDNNSATPNGAASGTACQSNFSTHCQYVNERPLNTTNFLQMANNTSGEEFTVQNPSEGDVDISSDNILGEEAWVYAEMASGTTTCASPGIFNNGNLTTLTLTTSYAMYTNMSNTTAYPNTFNAVGMDSCNNASGTHSLNFAEGGTQIAYEAPTSGSLINFPVLVSLSSDSDLSSKAQSNGSDILFTDSTGRNLLPFEIENYTAGTLKAWVNVSSLSVSNDTIIYMYYGNPATTSQANGTGTWNSNYGAAWHFTGGSLPNTCGTTLGLSDSTSNAFTLTNHSTTATTGEICGGASFDGSTKYLQGADSSVFNPGSNAFSATTWINEATNNTYYTLFQHMNTTNDSTGWQLYLNRGGCTAATSGWLCLWDGATDVGVYAGLTASTWTQVDYVRSGSTVIFYVNGHEVGTITGGDGVQTTFPSGTGFPEYIGDDPGQGIGFYSGSMDEFEYSQTNLTPGWIWTEYNNQSNPGVGGFTKSPLGSVETNIYAPTLSELMRGGKWFDSTGKIQPFNF